MTLQDLKEMDREFITPAIAGQILGCDPNYIRVAARKAREALGFPVILINNRVKIPKAAFINFMEGTLTLDRRTPQEWGYSCGEAQ